MKRWSLVCLARGGGGREKEPARRGSGLSFEGNGKGVGARKKTCQRRTNPVTSCSRRCRLPVGSKQKKKVDKQLAADQGAPQKKKHQLNEIEKDMADLILAMSHLNNRTKQIKRGGGNVHSQTRHFHPKNILPGSATKGKNGEVAPKARETWCKGGRPKKKRGINESRDKRLQVGPDGQAPWGVQTVTKQKILWTFRGVKKKKKKTKQRGGPSSATTRQKKTTTAKQNARTKQGFDATQSNKGRSSWKTRGCNGKISKKSTKKRQQSLTSKWIDLGNSREIR